MLQLAYEEIAVGVCYKKDPMLGQTKDHSGVVSCLRVVSTRNRQVQSDLSQPAFHAALAYLGQEQFTHSEAVSKGEAPFPVKVVTLGNTTGKSS